MSDSAQKYYINYMIISSCKHRGLGGHLNLKKTLLLFCRCFAIRLTLNVHIFCNL